MGGRPFDPFRPPTMPVDLAVTALFFTCLIGLVILYTGHPALAPLPGTLDSLRREVQLRPLPSTIRPPSRSPGRSSAPCICPNSGAGIFAPALALAMAGASWRWIESPILRLKERYDYGPPRVPTPIEPVAPEATGFEGVPPVGLSPASRLVPVARVAVAAGSRPRRASRRTV